MIIYPHKVEVGGSKPSCEIHIFLLEGRNSGQNGVIIELVFQNRVNNTLDFYYSGLCFWCGQEKNMYCVE